MNHYILMLRILVIHVMLWKLKARYNKQTYISYEDWSVKDSFDVFQPATRL